MNDIICFMWVTNCCKNKLHVLEKRNFSTVGCIERIQKIQSGGIIHINFKIMSLFNLAGKRAERRDFSSHNLLNRLHLLE